MDLEFNLSYDHYIAGSIVVVVGVVGIILNVSSFIMLHQCANLRGSFVIFCMMNCAINTSILLIFISWTAPSLFFGHNPVYGIINQIVSQAGFLLWLASVNCQVTLASNRFVSIYLPMSYESLFCHKNMLIYITIFWIITIIAPAIGFIDKCNIYFDATTFVWQFNTAPCGSHMFFWMGFMYEIVVLIIVIALDTAIFIKLRQIKKQNLGMNIGKEQNLKRDIRFFWQAFLTNLNFTFVLLNFNLIRMLAKTRFQGFLAVTFVWELGHLIDGLILVVSNQELRKRFFHPQHWFFGTPTHVTVVASGTFKA